MANKQPENKLERISDITRNTIDLLKIKQAHPELYRPIPTGLDELDKIIVGIEDATFTVIGGEAKAGKSSFLLHIAGAIAAANRGKVIFYSLEELKDQIGRRSLSKLSMVTSRPMMRKLLLTEANFADMEEQQKKLEKLDLWVDDGITQAEWIINYALETGAKYVFADYLQLMTDRVGKNDGWERYNDISRMFLEARNKHNLTFIISYQIGKSGTAFGTTSIYRDADLVIEVGGKGKDKMLNKEVPGLLSIRVLPSRICLGGSCNVYFNGDYNRFSNEPYTTDLFM